MPPLLFPRNLDAASLQVIQKHTGLQSATFQQLYDHTGILLKIFATSLRNGGLIEFSAEKTPNDQVGGQDRPLGSGFRL